MVDSPSTATLAAKELFTRLQIVKQQLAAVRRQNEELSAELAVLRAMQRG